MNNNDKRRGMSPRDRYFAAQKENAEIEKRRAVEAQRAAAERARQAQIAEQKRIYEEKMRRRREHEKEQRRRRARIFGGRFVLFAVMFTVVLFIALLCVFISFRKTNSGLFGDEVVADGFTFVYVNGTVEDGEKPPKWEQGKNESVKDGVRYINFTRFAEILGMTVTGSADELRFITGDASEEVRFTVGSEVALVNSTSYRMEAKTYEYSSGGIFVPLSFITDCMSGITIAEEEDGETITITSEKAIVTFLMKPADAMKPVVEEDEYGDTTAPSGTDTDPEDEIPAVEFLTDLSEYEEYMNPEDRDAYLILVNAWNKLDEDDIPNDLVDVINTRTDRKAQQLRLYAAKALEALFIELYANGYDDKGPSGYPVSVMSAYRSYTYQNQLFNQYVDREMNDDPSLSREEAEAITEKYSARPGTSEHQTGLCLDMHNLSSAQKAFANEEAYAWLEENCWKFGFILRFPEGKTDITGITYEPWHYRYVGRYHAYRIHELDICLEEYIEMMDE